jgi:hypothetical protein
MEINLDVRNRGSEERFQTGVTSVGLQIASNTSFKQGPPFDLVLTPARKHNVEFTV